MDKDVELFLKRNNINKGKIKEGFSEEISEDDMDSEDYENLANLAEERRALEQEDDEQDF
jgi:hypothetical protein